MESKNENAQADPAGQITVKVTEIEPIAPRTIRWVDAYLQNHKPIPWGIFAVIFCFALVLGAGSDWLYQRVTHNTFRDGYEARELQQFHNTATQANLLVTQVDGDKYYRFEQLNFRGERTGEYLSHKFCTRPGSWQVGQIIRQLTYEEKPECESVSFPELGWTGERDENQQPINLLAKGAAH